MTTSRRTVIVREVISELYGVLGASSSSIDVLDQHPGDVGSIYYGEMDVEYNGHAMRIIVEDCDP